MLKLNRAQMTSLEGTVLRAFNARVCSFLREQFLDATDMPLKAQQEAVAEQIERGRRHGLETEHQLLSYVITAWMLGATFDEQFPAAGMVLRDRGYSPEDKREWLEGWAVELLARLAPDTLVPTFPQEV